MYHSIPNQRIPLARKGEEFKKNTMDAYLDLVDSRGNSRRDNLQMLYDYYNGVINSQDYDYVLRPYGKNRTSFPSKMRNYPLIKPVIDYLLGEKSKRPFNYSVVVRNQDTVSEKENALHGQIRTSIEQMFVNEMNKAGLETGQPTQEPQLPQQITELFNRSYVDNRAVLGQKGMTYILQEAEVHEKLQRSWFHFLVAGECFSERTVRNNEVEYSYLNPMDIDYDLDPELDYVEDSDWVCITRYMSPSQIVEKWGKRLKPDEIDEIFSDAGKGDYFAHLHSMNGGARGHTNRLTQVRTLYWQGMQRKGIVSYMDPLTGAEEMFDVEDGWKMPEELKELGAKIEWLWDNRVWHGTRIGDQNSGIDVDVEEYPYERRSVENISKNKIPINGRRYSDVNSSNISTVFLGIPYQLNYNVYKYRLELAIARSKDIIAQFDINLIPKKWTFDKWMEMVEGSGIAWVDYNKEGIRLNPQHQTVMDLSIKTIDMYLNLLMSIEEEWYRVAGVNKQRLGEMSQYQGKAIGQQAIVQSSHTTEDLYRKFGGFEQRDMQALLDLSKHAWKKGKRTSFVMPDGTRDYLDIDPDSWDHADLGIFMSDASADQEKKQHALQMVQSMINQGAPASAALEIIDQDSFVLMKEKIKGVEAQLQAAQQQSMEAEMTAQKQEAQAEMELKTRELDLKEQEILSKERLEERKMQNTIEVAHIQANSRNNAPVKVEAPKIEKAQGPTVAELSLKNRETSVKEGQLDETVRHNMATESITRNKPKPSSK